MVQPALLTNEGKVTGSFQIPIYVKKSMDNLVTINALLSSQFGIYNLSLFIIIIFFSVEL